MAIWRLSKGSDLVWVSLLYVLLIVPIIGIFLISTVHSFYPVPGENARQQKPSLGFSEALNTDNKESSFY